MAVHYFRLAITSCVFGLLFWHVVHGQAINDVVITEIMADPSPAVGLPEAEYLELYNRTDKPISVRSWKLVMGTRSVSFPDSVLLPHTYTILCHKNDAAALAPLGVCIALNSFSLSNDGASLALYTAGNRLIYTINYLDRWWPSEKRAGGFALEMVDISAPCLERANWGLSQSAKGGTPGQPNSIEATRVENVAPGVARVEIPGNGTLVVCFDKRMDSLGAVRGAAISLSGRSIVKRSLVGPGFRNLVLTFDAALLANERYDLLISNMPDCAGNLLRNFSMQISLPVPADSGDVVINEILFNPRENGVDFVEIYNRSAKYISLKNWTLGNIRNANTDVIRDIATTDAVLAPGGFWALTPDAYLLGEQYSAGKQTFFYEMPSFPEFSNESGGVILLGTGNRVFDRFLYSKSMHHPFLNDVKGVSLERSDPGKSAAITSNWHSAASVAGYATPGYVNSQFTRSEPEVDFIVNPEAFTPDGDHVDDFMELEYRQTQGGKIGTVRVFDINGRPIKYLLRNQLIGTAGKIIWNGQDENNRAVATGYYLILIETFDLQGNKSQYKKRVVVASR